MIMGLIFYILYQLRYLIIYMAIAIVIALLGRPMVLFLKRKFHIDKSYGAIITILVMFALLVGLLALLGPMLTEQGKKLALFDYDSIQVELDKIYNKI